MTVPTEVLRTTSILGGSGCQYGVTLGSAGRICRILGKDCPCHCQVPGNLHGDDIGSCRGFQSVYVRLVLALKVNKGTLWSKARSDGVIFLHL